LLGGVIGVAVGFGLEPVLSAIAAMLGVSFHKLIGGAANFFLPAPSLEAAALALAVTLALGLAFGSYPAHRAARLDPIQALRRV
jgi:putative ABC transport system permease protein